MYLSVVLGAWSVRFAGWADWVDCRCFLSFVFLGVARSLELSPCNTTTRSSHILAVSNSFKHILYSLPAGAFTEYIMCAPVVSVLPAGTVAQRFGRGLLVVVLHLLSNSSCRREVGASWSDVAGTLVAGIGGPQAEVAGLVARPLPLGEMARVVAQLGCDRGLHQHVHLRVQSVPVVGGDTLRKQHRQGIASDDNTIHATAARSNADLTKPNQTPTRYTLEKNTRLLEVSISMWVRLCNHTYICTYIHGSGARRV